MTPWSKNNHMEKLICVSLKLMIHSIANMIYSIVEYPDTYQYLHP